MQIQLKLFASLREITGVEFEVIDLPETNATDSGYTLGRVRQYLAARGDQWAQAMDPNRAIRGAINQRMAHDSDPVSAGDEVAFFPPVTGG
jgi:sulfur-carrier protein